VNSFSKREKKYKSLVIISDGEDHDENAIAKAKEIGETGIIVHTVGVGSPEGTTILDPTTNAVKLDEQGNAVVSKLNENELKSIAASGRGTYSLLRNADVIAEKLVNEIDGMEQKSLGAVVYNSYDSYFQYFLLVAFVLILIEMFLPGANFKKQFIVVFVFFFASFECFAQKAEVKTGNTLYEQKKFAEAAKEYQSALAKDPKFAPSAYNLGNAMYQQKKFENARQVFNGATKLSDDKQLNSAANYNIGNTYLEEKKWQEAIDAYKSSLRKNPQDEAAKYNLSYAQAMLKKQQGGGGKNDQKKDQQDKKDQKENQQDKKDEKKDNQNKDQHNKDQQKPEEKDKQQPQPQDSKLSKEQADQLLNALSQEEKNLHDKKEKGKAVMIKVDKDW
jgi:tetratricopeptide (TPR) repeat protein